MNSNGFTTIGILEPEIAAMKEVTHFKFLHESHKEMDQLLQIDSRKRVASEIKFQEQFSGINKKFEDVTHTLAEIKLQLHNLVPKYGSENDSVLGVLYQTSGDKFGVGLPKIDFPIFDGMNPGYWILKCNSYFKSMPNIHDVQKINLATMHFDGKALIWYQNFDMGEIKITWEQFLEVVCARFEDLRLTNIIMELNKLKQDDTYDDYVERFAELKACMIMNDSNKYSEDYFTATFMSGLSKELQSFLHLFQPKTLEDTIELGREHIHTLEVISKRMSSGAKLFQNQSPTYRGAEQVSPQVSIKMSSVISTKPTTKLLTAAEMFARREKGLCYNVDLKFRIPEVKIHMAQTVEEVQDSIPPMFGEKGFITMRVLVHLKIISCIAS